MVPPDDATRRMASMLASRADHGSVTAERLAGTAAGVPDLDAPPVAHLVEGERPQFCFESAAEGVSVGDPAETVDPERGAVFVFTDRRILLLLGLADGDEDVSLAYGGVASADWDDEMGRHRLELDAEAATFHLWIPTTVDRDAVARAVKYVTYRHKEVTPDRNADADPDGSQTVRERLERLGDARSRGLLDDEEFQRRKEELLDE